MPAQRKSYSLLVRMFTILFMGGENSPSALGMGIVIDMHHQPLTQLESEFCVAEASWALNLSDENARRIYWQAREALQAAYNALQGVQVPCQRCTGSGVMERHQGVGGGICFRCRGRGKSAYRRPLLPAPPGAS